MGRSRFHQVQETWTTEPTLGEVIELAKSVSAPDDASLSVSEEEPDPPYAAPNWTVKLTWTA